MKFKEGPPQAGGLEHKARGREEGMALEDISKRVVLKVLRAEEPQNTKRAQQARN